MNNTNTNEKLRYLILLIVCFVLSFLGGTIFSIIVYPIVHSVTGIEFIEYSQSIAAVGFYGTKDIIEVGSSIGTAKEIFTNNPVLFENTKTVYCIIQFLSYTPVLLIAFYFLRKEFIKDFRSFIKDWKRNIIIVIISFIVMIVMANIIDIIYKLFKDEGESLNEEIVTLLLRSNGKWLMIIGVVIVGPIVEEIIYRRLLIDTCEKTFNLKPIFAIIISSLIFSLIHVTDLESLKYVFQYIALAIPICLSYHYSKNNIFVSLTLHIINNFISVIGVFFLNGLQ